MSTPTATLWLVSGRSWRNCGGHPWPRTVLGYWEPTAEEALATCRRLHPEFEIEGVEHSDRYD